MRVLFVANDLPGHAVHRYRCENMARVLENAGHHADVVYVGQARVRVAHDVVVLHRICQNAEGRAFARAARACGAVLVYSTDDLVFDPAAFSDDTPLQNRFRTFAPLHRAMLQEADAALASTDFLAQEMRMVSEKPVFTLRNFLSDELMSLSMAAESERKANDGSVTLGYLSGSTTHDADLALIAPTLIQILSGYSQTRLLLVGPVALPPALESVAPQIRHQSFVPWRELPYVLSGVDINLAPLAPGTFGDAKSEIKFLEAAAVGVPTLASPRAGFRELLGNQSEFIAATAWEWHVRLATWVESHEARRDAGKRAQTMTIERGAETACAAAVVGAFEQIVALQKRRNGNAAGHWVNWPLAPKYVVKAAIARAKNAIHTVSG